MESNLKARAFAAYLGSECQRYLVDHNVPSGKDDIIELDENNFYNLVNGNGIWYYKLLLKPLSSISDEDAIEVAKLIGARWNNDHDYIISGKLCIKGDTCNGMNENLFSYQRVTDYLRSRSYNLPFMGKDLIKENIAIIKTENI